MLVKKWDRLPKSMQKEELLPLYTRLRKKNFQLFFKRAFDIVFSTLLTVILSPVMLVLAIIIRTTSPGPVFYRQERVAQYGRPFRIFKFRTMVRDADKKGALVTASGDSRVTGVGRRLRKYRLDELPQLFNVFLGHMSFVGTRPEVMKYVNCYTPEMRATLLLPPGITSRTSILYKDEEKFLTEAQDPDDTYVKVVLPEKMKINLESLERFSLWEDIKTMLATVVAVFGDR